MRLLLLLGLLGCPDSDDSGTDDSGDVKSGCQTLVVEPTLLRWEAVVPGEPVSAPFVVTNGCRSANDALIFIASVSDPAFVVDRTNEIALEAGEAATLTVTFLAPDNESRFGTILLASNDWANVEQFVSLEGIVATDADGDGFPNLGAGGDDCDDTNAEVHPGANEVWYDGTDQDCDGANDYDQDADGWPAAAYGGNDCDDTDDAAHPGASEAHNDRDDDCDGWVDETFVLAGEVLITEVMATPGGVEDALGEWFEITNAGSGRVDLIGWEITNSLGISFVVDRHVEVIGGGRVVLGGNIDALSNGGVHVDAEFDAASFSLDDSDSLTLTVDGRQIAITSWIGALAGTARALDPDHINGSDASDSDWWCDATSTISAADRGTPAELNDQCTTVDEDGDGTSEADGDCNDADDTVNADATDVWDGLDNDCDGAPDNPIVTDVASAEITGSTTATYLGAPGGIGTGDVTGDGVDDLVLASVYASTYAGAAWVIDSSDVVGASAAVSSIDTATVNAVTYSYAGALPPHFADGNGDGTADLTVGGSPYVYYGGYAACGYTGGASLSGTLDCDDAAYTLEADDAYGYGSARMLADLDLNGDGVAELVRGNGWGSDGALYYTGEVTVFDVDGASGSLDNDDALAVLHGEAGSAYLGLSIAGGDTDGDGYDDLVLGSPGAVGTVTGGGVAYIVSGLSARGEDDVDDVASTTIYGSVTNGRLGQGGMVVADLDASGGLDLAIGGSATDAAYIFLDVGSAGGEVAANDADTTLLGTGSFGFSLHVADFDRDGALDLAVGAPALNPMFTSSYAWYTATGSAVGYVSIFDRSVLTAGGDHDTTEAFRGLTGSTSGDLFGAVLGGGDFDSDGVTDAVVAAPLASTGTGTVYMVLGN